jgi:hypothetical protein
MSTKLAAAALAMGLLSFVHLFGVEKAALAVALGMLAIKAPDITPRGRRLALAAIAAGLAYLLVLAGVFLFHMPLLNDLAAKLAK